MAKKSSQKNKIDSKQVVKKSKKSFYIPWWASLIIIIAACIALYYPVINYGLVECDDHEIMHRDYDRISKIGDWEQEFFKSYMYNSYYRPLVTISLMLNAQMSEKEPYSYRLTNIIIHLFNALLIFYLLNLLGSKRFLPLIGGLIYAVHPVFTNAVAWIVGRNDLLLSLFFLSSFIFLVLYSQKKNLYFLILHFITYLLALFSKETAVFAGSIFLAYIFIIEKYKIKDKRTLFLGLTWFIALSIWLIFRSMAELGEPVYRSGLEVFLFNLRVIPEFIAKFFLPVHLSVLPTYSILNTVIGIAVMILLIFTIYRMKNLNYRFILFGSVWFLAIIVPGMFMTLLNSHLWNEYLECRAYLAMFGLLIISYELLKDFIEKHEIAFLITCLIICLILSALTYREKQNYEDAPKYYVSAVEDDPMRSSFQFLAGQVHINNLYKKTNDKSYLFEAEKYIKAAISLRPEQASYYRTLAAVYTYTNQHEIALTLLEKSLSMDSNQIDTYNGLGYTYYYLGRYKDEVNVLTTALKKWNDNQDIIYNLAVAYFALYNSDSALSLVNYSYKLDSGEKNSYELYHLMNNWGGTFIQKGYHQQGVAVLKVAAQIEPNRYAAYENLMNYYLMVYNRPDSAAYFAKILLKQDREIAPNKLEFLEPFLN